VGALQRQCKTVVSRTSSVEKFPPSRGARGQGQATITRACLRYPPVPSFRVRGAARAPLTHAPACARLSHLLPFGCRALLLVHVSAAFAPASVLRAGCPTKALEARHAGTARLCAEATRAGDLRSPRQGGAQRPRSWWQRQPRGRMPRPPSRASPPNALVSRLWPAPLSAGTRGLVLRASEAGAHAPLNMPSGACAHAPRARSRTLARSVSPSHCSLVLRPDAPLFVSQPPCSHPFLALSRACALYSIGVTACAALFLCMGSCRDTLGHLVYTARGADDACGRHASSRAPLC
jgi:hypothetical protein